MGHLHQYRDRDSTVVKVEGGEIQAEHYLEQDIENEGLDQCSTFKAMQDAC